MKQLHSQNQPARFRNRPAILWLIFIALTTSPFCSSASSRQRQTGKSGSYVITFNPIPTKLTCDADFSPDAQGPAPITYASSDISVATIVNGLVHITGAGSTTITASDGNETASQQLVVDTPPIVSFGGDITIKSGTSVDLVPVITNADNKTLSYSWSPAYGLNSITAASPVATPALTTTYTLSVSVNGGCTQTATVTVNVVQSIAPPTAFTPNGDGVNDQWNIPALKLYPNCIVSVFNRYGKRIYSSRGYPRSWDGSLGGSRLATGTYYYIIDPGNGGSLVSGAVSIIR